MGKLAAFRLCGTLDAVEEQAGHSGLRAHRPLSQSFGSTSAKTSSAPSTNAITNVSVA
jgi:hypothetical protein